MAHPRETRGLSERPLARGERAAAPPRAAAALGGPRARGNGAPRRARFLGRLGAAALALCACEPYVEGNGVFLEQDRSAQVGPFVGIHVEDRIQAAVTSGVEPQAVLVSGDANVVPYVRTEVRQVDVPRLGGTVTVLFVFVDLEDFEPAVPVTTTLELPEVKYLQVLEAAKVDLRDAATANLVVDGRDGAEVLVRGAGGTGLDATLDGAALDAGSYLVDAADVVLTSRSRVELHADGAVLGSASGGSEVDNQLGTGVCAVSKDATSLVTCQQYAHGGP